MGEKEEWKQDLIENDSNDKSTNNDVVEKCADDQTHDVNHDAENSSTEDKRFVSRDVVEENHEASGSVDAEENLCPINIAQPSHVTNENTSCPIEIPEPSHVTNENTSYPINIPEQSHVTNEDTGCPIDIAELIPDLENYDPNILDILPANVRKLAASHVQRLKLAAKSSISQEEKKEDSCYFKKSATQDKASTSMHKFLTDNSSNSVDDNNKEEKEKCPKCSNLISPFDLPEHLDYHFAKELMQNESKSGSFSKSSSSVSGASGKGLNGRKSLPEKRKRSLDHEGSGKNGKRQHKDIKLFFQKS